MSYSYDAEFERIAVLTDVDGCGGDCENCDCASACSYARLPDDNDHWEDDE